MGFENYELERLLQSLEKQENPLNDEEQEQKDEFIPKEIPERVKLGDIWLLGNHKLICGDSFNPDNYDALFEEKKIDCVMSSPPYYGLRDYGVENQMGLEEHPKEFIKKMIYLTFIIKRHLKLTGSIYYNLGDTYFGSMQGYGQKEGQGSGIQNANDGYFASSKGKPPAGNKEIKSNWLQPKQLMLMPSRVAVALQDEGFILRNDIIWHKPNPMPSSVKDRLNNTYEHIFHFVVNKKYFYDLDAIREPHKHGEGANFNVRVRDSDKERFIQKATEEEIKKYNVRKGTPKGQETMIQRTARARQLGADRDVGLGHLMGKNPGDLFEITTQPYAEAHFATYPVRLCEKPILSSCPEQICVKCGEIRERISELDGDYKKSKGWKNKAGDNVLAEYVKEGPVLRLPSAKTLGFTKCQCNSDFISGIVFDPFLGAGTTLIASEKLNRICYGIELNPKYCDLILKRFEDYAGKKAVLLNKKELNKSTITTKEEEIEPLIENDRIKQYY